jgi:peptidoglycan/LPS O-acetylase OafA/YrhL
MLYFSNFVLDLFNKKLIKQKFIKMKKVIFSIGVIIALIASISIYFSTSDKVFTFRELGMIIAFLLVTGFAVFLLTRRLSSLRKKLPAEDELSKKVMKRAASTSYYISLYLWLGVMFISDKVEMETHTLIGIGILMMAVVFASCWLIFNYWGTADA